MTGLLTTAVNISKPRKMQGNSLMPICKRSPGAVGFAENQEKQPEKPPRRCSPQWFGDRQFRGGGDLVGADRRFGDPAGAGLEPEGAVLLDGLRSLGKALEIKQ